MDATLPYTATSLARAKRIGYAASAVVLLALAIYESVQLGAGWWQFPAFGLGPDLALVFGAAPGLANGQLHPRAVPAYNIAHRLWGPLALATGALVALMPLALLVGAMVWAAHVTLDRALGYGLRTADGFQRS
jgi:hypothetical protein